MVRENKSEKLTSIKNILVSTDTSLVAYLLKPNTGILHAKKLS